MSRFNKQIKKTEAELLKAEETVSNLKEKADYVCKKPNGDGVTEAVEKFIFKD